MPNYMTPADELASTAALLFGIERRDLLGYSRSAPVVRARQALAWALRSNGWSLEAIGDFIRRHHSTVMEEIKLAERRAGQSEQYANMLAVLAGRKIPPLGDWLKRIEALEYEVAELRRLIEEERHVG